MEFVFTCPVHKKVFNSAFFSIIENKGVKIDSEGNKTLDAKVKLDRPCPFCGRQHAYRASELACPFG